jgi:hypothetical protein
MVGSVGDPSAGKVPVPQPLVRKGGEGSFFNVPKRFHPHEIYY